jgi:hypothetical protein
MMNYVTIIMKIKLKRNKKKIIRFNGVKHIIFWTNIWLFWKCYNYGTRPWFQTIGPFPRSPLRIIELSYIVFGQPRNNQKLKCHIKWLLNGNSYIKITILPHIYQICFFKAIKVLIHSVISSSWMCIHKGKLLRCQFQTCDVRNKSNLAVILHYDLGYMDLSKLRISLDYLSWLKKMSL